MIRSLPLAVLTRFITTLTLNYTRLRSSLTTAGFVGGFTETQSSLGLGERERTKEPVDICRIVFAFENGHADLMDAITY